ncbi:MAG: L-threonylcarbamoyladenylate synthase [Candidatus Zixiibacteriota bacterium]
MKNKIRIEPINYYSPDKSVVLDAAKRLTKGELIIAPTETRYGLLVRADSIESLTQLYEIKKRQMSLPTAIFVNSLSEIADYGVMNQAATKFAKEFLPGPLTLVLKAVKDFDEPLVIDNKIGIRWSSAPFIEMLLKEIEFPITATSANLSGDKECESIEEICRIWKGKIGLYVDSGSLNKTTSTVIDLSLSAPKVLREGAISVVDIKTCIKSLCNYE